MPGQVKKSFVTNYINTAKKRCKEEADQRVAEAKIKNRLKKNGFNDNDIERLSKCNDNKSKRKQSTDAPLLTNELRS